MFEKLLIFCLNLDNYLGDRKESKDITVDDIASGNGGGQPLTLGDKFKKALELNGVPFLWFQNKDLIFQMIELRNKFIHKALTREEIRNLENEYKYIFGYATQVLPDLFKVPKSLLFTTFQVDKNTLDRLLTINRKAETFLKEAFKCKQQDVGQMCLELYRRKEFKDMLGKFWDFNRLRNRFLHRKLRFNEQELKELNKFGRFLTNEVEKWNRKKAQTQS